LTSVFHFQNLQLSHSYGRSEGSKPSSMSSDSGEGLQIRGVGSALAEDTSSWLGIGSTWRGSKGGVLSRMRSKRASPSSVVLWVNEPLRQL
jgi:hypothetical protein